MEPGPGRHRRPSIVTARFPGDVVGTFEVSAYAHFTPPNAVSIHGTRGASWSISAPSRSALHGPRRLPRAGRDHGGRAGHVAVEEAFVAAIRGLEPVTLNDFRTGLAYMTFTDAVHASAASGRRIAL